MMDEQVDGRAQQLHDDQMDGSQRSHVCARVELARARGLWFYLSRAL